MCIDYRTLKRVTVKNNYHLLRVDDLLDRLVGTTYFSRIRVKLLKVKLLPNKRCE